MIKRLCFPLCVSFHVEIFYLIIFGMDICCETVSFRHVLQYSPWVYSLVEGCSFQSMGLICRRQIAI